ncbi:hypothetical protein O3G_MSEX002411 [Manduca sexta]|uniref:Uncharacterized protein n=1 Tax=Manduca sexta TaxID=7130 RepID=A0A921YNV0_MANSE|nr:hypothetical protein O3G_MSEX002411 [Manduca sexta]
MGKNKNKKRGPAANVFKVAGAKSLKKTKAKPVNLGLKNIKQKVSDIDKEFVEITKNPKPSQPKNEVKGPTKKIENPVSKEEMTDTAEQINKMDL